MPKTQNFETPPMITESDINRVRNKWYIILILKINAWWQLDI